jgi:hypothetical protein
MCVYMYTEALIFKFLRCCEPVQIRELRTELSQAQSAAAALNSAAAAASTSTAIAQAEAQRLREDLATSSSASTSRSSSAEGLGGGISELNPVIAEVLLCFVCQ